PGLKDRLEPVDQYQDDQEKAEEGEDDHVGFSPVKAAGRPARFPTRARRRRIRERGAAARGGRNAPALRSPAKTRAPPASVSRPASGDGDAAGWRARRTPGRR